MAGRFEPEHVTAARTPISKRTELVSLEDSAPVQVCPNTWDLRGAGGHRTSWRRPSSGAPAFLDTARPGTLGGLPLRVKAARRS